MFDLDEFYMRKALAQALEAYKDGEVPVGAAAVFEDQILGLGRNRVEMLSDPTAHAEMEAITAAANKLGDKHLTGVTLYVTLEPCPMCATALVLARVNRVVFAADDPKMGACGSVYRIHDDPALNHRFYVSSGILEEESRELLRTFFASRRTGK